MPAHADEVPQLPGQHQPVSACGTFYP
jgi:hypothetical protein